MHGPTDAACAEPESGRVGRWKIALLTLAVFLLAVHALPPLLAQVIRLEGYGAAAAVKTMQIVIVFLAIGSTHGTTLRRSVAEMGLASAVGRAAAVALIATAPMLLAFAATGALRVEFALLSFAVTAFFSPVAEEVLYRGYAFGQLYRRAGWSFPAAVLIPTVFFSMGHLYQAQTAAQALGVFAVTAIGSTWFAWLYARWGNLWVPILLHSLMNVWWYVFEVDTSALGGWLANGARVLTIILSIVLTLQRHRIWKPAPAAAPLANLAA